MLGWEIFLLYDEVILILEREGLEYYILKFMFVLCEMSPWVRVSSSMHVDMNKNSMIKQENQFC